MNRIRIIIGMVIGMCLAGQFAWAETAYIIDFTKVNVRSGPSTEYRVIATLSSGHPVEVLEIQSKWTHVGFKENSGTQKEGWTLNRYLMARQPWKMKAQILISENATLKEKLAPIQNRLEESNINEQNLKTKLKTSVDELDETKRELKSIKEGAAEYLLLREKHKIARTELKRIQKEYKALRESYIKLESSQKMKWFIAGGIVLMSGLFIGLMLGGRRRYSKPSLS